MRRSLGAIAFEVLHWVFRKPATENYPFEPKVKPDRFRGKLVFDPAKCIGCKLCMKDCPAGAIEIRTVAPKVFACDVRLDRCMFCGQCVDSCAKKALTMTREFELAGTSREALKMVYEPAPRPESAPVSQPAPSPAK